MDACSSGVTEPVAIAEAVRGLLVGIVIAGVNPPTLRQVWCQPEPAHPTRKAPRSHLAVVERGGHLRARGIGALASRPRALPGRAR